VEARDVGGLGRVYSIEALHRALPAAVGVRLAGAAGWLSWVRPGTRRAALDRAAGWLGPEADRGELRRLARRHLYEQRASSEIFWRPWLARGMRIEGLEHLDAARRDGRGVILAGLHSGPMWSLHQALALRGVRLYVSRARPVEGSVHSGPGARYPLVNVRRLEQAGCVWVGRGDSFRLWRALLERGEACWLAFDIPPRRVGRETVVAGHGARLASGIASLACDVGAPVVPAFTLRDGPRPVGRVLPPVEPGGLDAEEMHRRIADALGKVWRAHPEQALAQIGRLIGT
jgi:lauroyl/myristoyl acyltransferase